MADPEPREPARRWFFAPSRDGEGWEVVEATRTEAGWELRRPGRIQQEVLPEVPPKGADWREAKPPQRPPRLPAPPKPPKRPARPVRVPKVPVVKAPAPTPATPKAPPKAVPGLSRELEDLLAEEQLRQPAPAGLVKCPLCGLAIVPTRNKKVRTHVNPVKGERCPASGTASPA